jgi:hypothetical protein
VADYRTWASRSVPRPTKSQMQAFALFLSDDHSWYKKLPLHGPGEPFFCYIHPHMHQIHVDSTTGRGGWRDFVDNETATWTGDRLRVQLQPGDVEPELWQPVTQIAGGRTTAEVWTARSRFSYWNFGSPGQPPAEALSQAEAGLKILDDDGSPVGVPGAGLAAGLVYLRGTVSPRLWPTEERYESLRAQYDLPRTQTIDERRLLPSSTRSRGSPNGSTDEPPARAWSDRGPRMSEE